ncbi:hypothetical protein EXIGLDRAFT_723013 [Exidia glandulosa HHB12029]|uniref:GST N-terminal domain-containing protein n=1 Tax=Exidia glandulosa HHB12029 TaxID=1314781 RepID=A0A165F066_EXIGL|nr:hypothetical protein EXIGLDRAFT_723013 [Exidia glandulosa HHB12029]
MPVARHREHSDQAPVLLNGSVRHSGDNYEPWHSPATMSYTLFHADSSGSVVALIMLRQLNVAHEVITLEYDDVTARKDSPDLRRLLKANPLAQFPTLITPDGTVLTEMSAILLYLVHRHGNGTSWDLGKLTPGQLATFYRVMVIVPAVVYPTITYIEFPERFIEVPSDKVEAFKDVQEWMKAGGEKKREEAYKLVEGILREFSEQVHGGDSSATKFALGTPTPTVLDVMLAVVVHYAPHPRPTWLEEHCPGLFLLAKGTINFPGIVEIFRESKYIKEFIAA